MHDRKSFYVRSVTVWENPFGWRRVGEPLEEMCRPSLDEAREALKKRVADLQRCGWWRREGSEDAATMTSGFDHGSQASQFEQDVEIRLSIS